MRRLVPGDALDDLLEPYRDIDRTPRRGRTWVLANMVGGLDGSAAFGGRVGPLSTGADVELFRAMRAVADVVLVGAATFRLEGYGPVRLGDERRAERVAAGRAPVPPLAVVSRSLALDWTAAPFVEAENRPVVVTCTAADAARLDEARRHADVIVAGSDAVDLAAALDEFAARGWPVVLCEGGPTLLGELVAGGLLDELCLTLSPVMGGDPLPVAVSPPSGGVTRFALRHAASDGESLFLRYEHEVAGGR